MFDEGGRQVVETPLGYLLTHVSPEYLGLH